MLWNLALALHFLQEDPSAAPPVAANGSALAEMIHNSGPVAFAVLILLLIASIFSWAIMLSKWSSFGKAESQSKRFLRAFRKSGRLSEIANHNRSGPVHARRIADAFRTRRRSNEQIN